MIVSKPSEVRNEYDKAASRGWVLPCICTENLTTTEAILAAASEYGTEHCVSDVPVIIAITNNYSHRSQSVNYTHTRDWACGLRLFRNDILALAGPGAPYENAKVMLHLDHVQYDIDKELLEGDLSGYASIMYDASALPLDENIRLTAEFVRARGDQIVIEGACDEIVDATGSVHNDLTTAEVAERYLRETGVEMIVANLGTEHRATGKELKYHGERAREIKDRVGTKIVLHGTSSVTNDQVRSLFADGICKVNIWTALERDSSAALFGDMVRNASKVAGPSAIDKLIEEGYLTDKCRTDEKISISHFTYLYRQGIIYEEMKKIVRSYFDLWYL
ncbi:MAG: class II fructose-bisphosphate aldolase [Saccharofermentanales bacterium]